MMARLTIGWLLLEQTILAREKLKTAETDADKSFYSGKKAVGIHYARNLVPEVVTDARILRTCDTTPVEIDDLAFGPDFS